MGLANSALTIGKEALAGAFFTYLAYSRDKAARHQDHLDVPRAACLAFIARVGSELEERSRRQESWGLSRGGAGPIVEQLVDDLHTTLLGLIQDAMKGRHGDQQIITPPPSAAWGAADEHIAARRARESAAAFAASVVPLESVPATGAVAPGPVGRKISATMSVPAEFAATVEAGELGGSPPLPPGAETLLPPVIGRLSATLEGADLSASGVVFPKQELICLLEGLSPDDVERVFKAVAEARRHSVGGNNPPEDVEELVTGVVVARDVLLEELSTDQPRVSVIRLAARAFVRAAGWLGEQGRWLIALGVGGVAAGVGKKLGEDHAEQIMTHLVAMESKLTAIVTPIAHIFTSMHLPF